MPTTNNAATSLQKLKTTITSTTIKFEGQVKSAALSDRIKNVPRGSALKMRMQAHKWAAGAGKEKSYQFVLQRFEGVDSQTKKEKWKDVVSKKVTIGTGEFKFDGKLDALGKGDYRVKVVLRPALGPALAIAGSVYAAPTRGSESTLGDAPSAGSAECFDEPEAYNGDEPGTGEGYEGEMELDDAQGAEDGGELAQGEAEGWDANEEQDMAAGDDSFQEPSGGGRDGDASDMAASGCDDDSGDGYESNDGMTDDMASASGGDEPDGGGELDDSRDDSGFSGGDEDSAGGGGGDEVLSDTV